jgi:hypothetical protein
MGVIKSKGDLRATKVALFMVVVKMKSHNTSVGEWEYSAEASPAHCVLLQCCISQPAAQAAAGTTAGGGWPPAAATAAG